MELEDIDQERLDIDVFWLFSFLLNRPRNLHLIYRHIVAVKATIDKQSPHAKLLCLNIPNEVEISSF